MNFIILELLITCLIMTYLLVNGEKDYISCHNYSREEIVKYVEYLKNKSGIPIARLRKFWHTDTPSVQGVWTPFTNKDPTLINRNIPDSTLSDAVLSEKSATDVLRDLASHKTEVN